MFVLTILISITIGAFAAPVDPLTNFFRDKTKIDKPFETNLIHTKPGFGYYVKEMPISWI